MVFQNTYRGFFYRQIFVTPALITPSTVSLIGKTGIVTGSNTGLGYHASSQLLSLGLSRLILAVRDIKKGEAAKTSLLDTLKRSSSTKANGSTAPPIIEVWPVDMTEYTSITAFADRVRNTPDFYVDFCILNAGVARFGYEKAPNGNELTIQTNWLGTALLASTLRPILQAQYTRRTSTSADGGYSNGTNGHSSIKPPVLSIVGSEVAQWAAFKEPKIAEKEQKSIISVLNEKSRFDPGDRYYTSKLLLALFFRDYNIRLPASNAVILNLVNPGFCYGSELHRSLTGALGKVFGGMKRAIGRSTEVGARTLVHGAVVAGEESKGAYLSDEHVAPWMDFVVGTKGEEVGRALWKELGKEFRAVVDLEALMKEG